MDTLVVREGEEEKKEEKGRKRRKEKNEEGRRKRMEMGFWNKFLFFVSFKCCWSYTQKNPIFSLFFHNFYQNYRLHQKKSQKKRHFFSFFSQYLYITDYRHKKSWFPHPKPQEIHNAPPTSQLHINHVSQIKIYEYLIKNSFLFSFFSNFRGFSSLEGF